MRLVGVYPSPNPAVRRSSAPRPGALPRRRRTAPAMGCSSCVLVRCVHYLRSPLPLPLSRRVVQMNDEQKEISDRYSTQVIEIKSLKALVFLEDFLDLSGDASDGSFHGENNALAFAEQMEFQFLSEQLGIAITDNEESPQLDAIYGTPLQLSSLPLSSCSIQGLQNIGSPVKVQLSSPRSSSGSATTNKARLRWTLELHERFMEAVNKLEGPENRTEHEEGKHNVAESWRRGRRDRTELFARINSMVWMVRSARMGMVLTMSQQYLCAYCLL